MPIDTLEMLEFFEAAVWARAAEVARPADNAAAESHFATPPPGATDCPTLATALAGAPDLMTALADEFEADGATALAAIAREVHSYLAEHGAALEAAAKRQRRLLDYVYPVV